MYVWELLQNIVGLFVIFITGAKKEKLYGFDVWVTTRFQFGISLGKYIIIGSNYRGKTTVLHEHGHQLQSRKLGPLYLFVVGIPFAARNIWDVLFHKDWTYTQRSMWYYGHFPERQADILGGVIRDYSF